MRHSGKIKEICTYDVPFNIADPANADEELKNCAVSIEKTISKINPLLSGKMLSNQKSVDDAIVQLIDPKELPNNLNSSNSLSYCIAKGISVCKELPLYKCK
jgi:enolase